MLDFHWVVVVGDRNVLCAFFLVNILKPKDLFVNGAGFAMLYCVIYDLGMNRSERNTSELVKSISQY